MFCLANLLKINFVLDFVQSGASVTTKWAALMYYKVQQVLLQKGTAFCFTKRGKWYYKV